MEMLFCRVGDDPHREFQISIGDYRVFCYLPLLVQQGNTRIKTKEGYALTYSKCLGYGALSENVSKYRVFCYLLLLIQKGKCLGRKLKKQML